MFENKYSKFIHSLLWGLLGGGTLFFPLFVFPKTGEIVNLPKIFFLFVWVAALLLFWGVGALAEKKLLIRRSMLDVPLLLFVLSGVISGLFSISQRTSFLGDTQNFTLNFLVVFLTALFAYLLIQILRTQKSFSSFIQIFLLSNIAVNAVFFFVQTSFFKTSSLFPLFGENFFNTVSGSNSIFGIWVASLGVLSVGRLLLKGRSWLDYSLAGVSALLSLLTLFRLGFTLPFAVYAVGLGIVLVLPFLFAKSVHFFVSLGVFALFLLTLTSLIFGDPKAFKMNIPVEIALGNTTSLEMTKGVLATDVKHFLFGSGPATFLYDFSLQRTPAFNNNTLVATTRFHSPFSTFLALFAEMGIVGGIFFLLILLIGGGAIVSTWVELRSSWKENARDEVAFVLHHPSFSLFSQIFDVFVLGAAWIALTVGLFTSFFDLTAWWTWWSFLGLIIVGIGLVHKKFVVESPLSLRVSPQYSLALSFGVIFFFTLVILSAAFGVRMYLGEYYFFEASKVSSLPQAEGYVQRSIQYRKNYSPYHLSLARIYLQQAKQEFEKNPKNIEGIATLVANGTNEARTASQIDPKNVATAETLALMYLNAEAFAPEATTWAKDALLTAITLEPSNALNHLRLADVYAKLGSLPEAEKEYQEAIQLKPDYVTAYVELAEIYRGQEKYNEALALYKTIVASVPDNPQVLYNYGVLFFNRHAEGDDAQAEQLWIQAIKFKPDYSNALYSLGLLYERMGNKAKALPYFQKVQELNPQNQDVKAHIRKLEG